VAPLPHAVATPDDEKAKGTIGRALHIVFAVAWYGAWRLLRRLGFARRSTPAKRFADLLEHLGTTFVKLGQQLSLRSDLFPPDYLAALQSLQDNVKPFPAEQAANAIMKAFGRPPSELFAQYDADRFPEPGHLFKGEARSRQAWRDFSSEQGFAGVNVSYSSNQVLIEQLDLDRLARALQRLGKIGHGKPFFQRLRTELLDSGGRQRKPSEVAGVFEDEVLVPQA